MARKMFSTIPEVAPGDGGMQKRSVAETLRQPMQPENMQEFLIVKVREQKEIVARLKYCKEQGMVHIQKGMFIFAIDNAIKLEETQLENLEAQMFA